MHLNQKGVEMSFNAREEGIEGLRKGGFGDHGAERPATQKVWCGGQRGDCGRRI